MQDIWNPKYLQRDLRMTARGGAEAIARKQAERLRAIVAFARAHSPYYRELYRDIPSDAPLTALPPVRKKDLMDRFDDWVTDPCVRWRDVESFVADPTMVGRLFLDYSVTETSGSIGVRGTILQDRNARAVYGALGAVRGWPGFAKVLGDSLRYLRRGFRSAAIITTGGHSASAGGMVNLRRRYPFMADRLRSYSILAPLRELVEQLNSYQPTHMITYPSMALMLAREQQVGRLSIRPINLFMGGETLNPDARADIEHALGCRVCDIYNSNEFWNMAHDCREGWLHLNTDWLVLEPVDRDYRPVPPGQASHSALLTNLANCMQPYIRYEMGDSIIVRPDPCACGSVFPAIRVMGRANEVLIFPGEDGSAVSVTPFAMMASVYDTPGLDSYQVIQKAPLKLALRTRPKPGWEAAPLWQQAAENLRSTLRAQGIPTVEVAWDPEPPRADPISGKLRRVFSECVGSDVTYAPLMN